MDGSLIRLPLDEGKPPLEADLRKDIYIQWAIMNQNWVIQKPNESMMIISNGRLELSVPKRDIMPPNFNAPHILVAIRECPIIGTVWVDKQGDEFLTAFGKNAFLARSHVSQSWHDAPFFAQQHFHVLNVCERTFSAILSSGDKQRAEAKLENREHEEAHQELVEHLNHRMRRLVEEGGNISGLPNGWEGLSPDIISELLTEVETVYRHLLQEKFVELGAWVDPESDLSLDRLEQDLKDMRKC